MMLVQKDFVVLMSRDPMTSFFNALYNPYLVHSIKTKKELPIQVTGPP